MNKCEYGNAPFDYSVVFPLFVVQCGLSGGTGKSSKVPPGFTCNEPEQVPTTDQGNN